MYVFLSPLCSALRSLLSTWAVGGDTLAYAVGYDDRLARRRSAGGRQWSWKLGAPAIGCAGVASSADVNHGRLSSDVYDATWLARVLLAARLSGKGWLYKYIQSWVNVADQLFERVGWVNSSWCCEVGVGGWPYWRVHWYRALTAALVLVDLCGFGNMTKVANRYLFYCDSGGFGRRCYALDIVPFHWLLIDPLQTQSWKLMDAAVSDIWKRVTHEPSCRITHLSHRGWPVIGP